MTQEYPQPHKQTRDSFITLYNTRLFTSDQVWDMCHTGRCVEREKVLDELVAWLYEEGMKFEKECDTEDDYKDAVSACARRAQCYYTIEKIKELRQEGKEER